MFKDLNREDKKLFVRDFVSQFFLILLRIIIVLVVVIAGFTLLWMCITNPIYIPVLIAIGVFMLIFKSAKSEATYRHHARENCKTRMAEAKQNIEDYQALKDRWEALTPIDEKQRKERENELSHCQHSIDWWKEKYDMALGEYLIKGGKIEC